MKNLKRIREPEVKKILRQEFKFIKQKTHRLNFKFKEVKFFWWYKPEGKYEKVYATCNKYTQRIRLSRRYYERNDITDFINIVRHEILHLIEPNHGPSFKALCKYVGTTRFANTMKGKE